MSNGARAVYIQAGRDPVLALVHEVPARERAQTSVVLLGPFGWQGMCAARALRGWALRLAAAGHPTVRIDLPGTGDSGGSPRDPGLLGEWVGAVRAAGELARTSWECPRLCVAGVELGGLLAILALSAGAAIDDLILWAVPSSGRALLRQWRAQAAIIAARHGEDQRAQEAVAELVGFALHEETAAGLAAVAPERIRFPVAPSRALVLARRGLRGDGAIAEVLAAQGTEVTREQTEDHDALLAHPQRALLPERTIALSREWLARAPAGVRFAATGTGGRSPASPAPSLRTAPEPRTQVTLAGDPSAVLESPLSMTLGGRAGFAILAAPLRQRPELAGACAVLFNAGALSHIGPNRMWVEAARRWAAQGIATVRVDLAGLGEADGDERLLVANPALYGPERLAEAREVLEALRSEGIAQRFVLGGLCAGANWALRTALAREDVAGVLAVNLYCVTWDLELVDEFQTARALASLRGSGWRRLARRDVTEEALLERVRSVGVPRLARALIRPAQRRQWREAQGALERLRDRGTRVQLLFSRSEPLAALLARGMRGGGWIGQTEAGEPALIPARWPNVRLAMLPTRDHMFRALWAQRHVHELLTDGLWGSLGCQAPGAQSLRPADAAGARRCAR